MPMINIIAVIVASIANFIIGAVYYGVLGKPWMAAAGITEEEVRGGQSPALFAMTFVNILVTNIALALFMSMAEISTLTGGIIAGILATVMVAATRNTNRLYEGGNLKLWLINMGHHAINLIVAGIILSLWQ